MNTNYYLEQCLEMANSLLAMGYKQESENLRYEAYEYYHAGYDKQFAFTLLFESTSEKVANLRANEGL